MGEAPRAYASVRRALRPGADVPPTASGPTFQSGVERAEGITMELSAIGSEAGSRGEARPEAIDSYRFLDFASRKILQAWAARTEPGAIPFTPLAKPLSECTVALLSTAGVARNDDRPFDQEGERRNPWWGDPSFRAIPQGTTERDVRLYHMHIDPRFGQADLDVVLPMRRLTRRETAARTHASRSRARTRSRTASGR